MKVADLQQHLADLARLLEASKASTVAKELVAIRDGLNAFGGLSLKEFADFLVRAEAYSRGEVPLKATPRKPPKPKAPAIARPNIDDLAREVQRLYERAADPAVTEEMIDSVVARLKPLAKAQLVEVADVIALKGMKSKNKDQVVAAIRHRIVARKGATQRAALLDRTAAPVPTEPNVGRPTPDAVGL